MFGSVDGIYGSPKIHQALQQEGIEVGQNRVARLMQENGLKARCARIYRSHAKLNRFYASIRNEIHEREATGYVRGKLGLMESGVTNCECKIGGSPYAAC